MILGKQTNISIYDYTGKLVHSQQINGNQPLILDTRSFAAGEYVVKVSGEKQSFSVSLLISR